MSKFKDWSKNHVQPAESKNIFPQVIAPSMEMSNDNSSQLNKVVESLQRGDMRKKQQNFQSQNSYPERFSF